MRQYDTEVIINAPVPLVWQVLTNFEAYPLWNPLVTYAQGPLRVGERLEVEIEPLDEIFRPVLTVVTVNQELRWLGCRFHRWLLAGEHYYLLDDISGSCSRLRHGERFTGLLSGFIRQALLDRMKSAFDAHNQALKVRVENG